METGGIKEIKFPSLFMSYLSLSLSLSFPVSAQMTDFRDLMGRLSYAECSQFEG